MPVATVSGKGWVVVPKEFRERYNLTPGRKVEIVDRDGVLLLIPIPDDPVAALRGMFAGESSLTQDLLAERDAERKREERKINPALRSG